MSGITLGIIGSGQLGSMLCQAAKKHSHIAQLRTPDNTQRKTTTLTTLARQTERNHDTAHV